MTKIIRGKQAEKFLKSIFDNDEPKIFLTDEQLAKPTVDKMATVEITREQFDDANNNGCGGVLARIIIRAYADQLEASIDKEFEQACRNMMHARGEMGLLERERGCGVTNTHADRQDIEIVRLKDALPDPCPFCDLRHHKMSREVAKLVRAKMNEVYATTTFDIVEAQNIIDSLTEEEDAR